MGDPRFALLSRHVILPQYVPGSAQQSVSAIIFVQAGVIEAVELLQDQTSVLVIQAEEVKQRCEGWDLVDFGEDYVSPGVIDCNVISNSRWETRDSLTKSAVSGGVTMLLEEPSLYAHPPSSTPLYCDIGSILPISSLTDFPHSTPAFAYKVYLSAPSAYTPGFSDPLEDLFDSVIQTPLPLFVDPSMPSQRMLYMASPYRLSSIEERLAAVYVDESGFAAGAFQDEDAVLSSPSETGEELMRPDRSQSTVDAVPEERAVFATPKTVDWHDLRNLHRQRGLTEDLEKMGQPDSHLPTIISDLNKRIDSLQESQYDLSVSEQMTYDGAGRYEYHASSSPGSGSGEKPLSSSSSSATSPTQLRPLIPAKPPTLLQRLKARPKPLSLDPKHSSDATERGYAFHLGNVPDYWEIKGVEKTLKAVRKAPCRVHFCNVASAAAVNKVRIFKENGFADSVSVETCPHYLYFTMDDISEGNTLLKAFPPIRNKSNCNLLWELLKVKAIDILASHHLAVSQELKFSDTGNFKKALNGVRGLGMGMQAVWTKLRMPAVDSQAVRERYLVRLAKWLSLNPARLIGVGHKRGSIEKGKFADFVVWRPHEEFEPEGEMNPYRGKKLYGKVKAVYVRGKLAFRNGEWWQVGQVMDRREIAK